MSAVLTPELAPSDAAQRPPLAHLRWPGHDKGLCGTPMQGKPAAPHADRCVVCAQLEADSHTGGRGSTP